MAVRLALLASLLSLVAAGETKYVVLEMYAAGSSTEDFSAPGNLDLFDSAGLIDYLATQAGKIGSSCSGGGSGGKCHESHRVALVKYQLKAFNWSKGDDWLASAFIPAFLETIQQSSNASTNASLEVLNFAMSNSWMVRQLREVISSESQWTTIQVEVAAVGKDDDQSLRQLMSQLNESDFNSSAEAFSKSLVKHGCTTARKCPLPQNVTLSLENLEGKCREGANWANGLCAWPSPGPGKATGFPMWLVAVIVVIVLLIAAGITWRCVCKRQSSGARLLGS
eukprot:Skav231599  [mRNA]  locus=scaffold232:355919:365778:+ [translate_table: standard]